MDLNKEKNIVIISHFSFKDKEGGAVFPQSIRNFLVNKMVKVRYIDNPFPDANFPASQIRIYEDGLKVYEATSPKIKLPTLILFTYQFFLTLLFLIIKPVNYDLCIACDNLSLISVFILRKMRVIRRLVYYTVDYSPKRYGNPFLNFLYQNLDRLANKISDVNWVAVENIITAKKQNGLDLSKCAPFQVVPIGFNKKEIIVRPFKNSYRFRLVFVGILVEKQGLQLVVKVLPRLIKEFPQINLTIVGSGLFESQIRRMVEEEQISSHVKFTGYISDHKAIVKILTRSGIGLATYSPSIGDYTYYADPSKIKLYLLCGLPTIITKVPPIAKEVKRKKAGFVINYSQKDLLIALKSLLKNDKTFLEFRKNALEMAKDYDNNYILDKAFKELS